MSQPPPNATIPISFRKPQTPVRLLELPPSLLDLLTSADPPTLYFKAPPQTPLSADPHAVLCTPTQTFSVRQVSTSNALYLAQAHSPPDRPPGITISSTAGCYMELQPSRSSATKLLRETLPVWPPRGPAPPAAAAAGFPGGRAKLLSDVPASAAEFAAAWAAVGAFEHAGGAWRYDAAEVLGWVRRMGEVRLVEGGEWRRDWGAEFEGEEGWVAGLEEVLVSRLEGEEVPAWIGRLVLEAHAREAVYEEKVVDMWKAALPVGWEKYGEEKGSREHFRELCKGWFCLPTPVKIRFLEPGTEDPYSEETKMAQKKSKWHEKFAATRKK